jgi:signal transduction histidine kinase/CheY-like chemotaxis protein
MPEEVEPTSDLITNAEPSAALQDDTPVPLESILCTEELRQRPARQPDYEAENRALVALTQALADSPSTILQAIADTILEVFNVQSAGLSLLTKDEKKFYWPAIAGAWRPYIGGGTPRDFGPCGDVLDHNTPLLFKHFERRYPYYRYMVPLIDECLFVPFYVEGKIVGTVWAIMHDSSPQGRKFDAEDLRQLESLCRVAAIAYRVVVSMEDMELRGQALQKSHAELAQYVQHIEDSRRAALNLMEDAVQTREALKVVNAELKTAKAIAEKASMAKSAFLSSMSHELRTPLSAILGFAQLLESAAPPPTPQQKRSIDQILRAGWYLLELINEILDLALIESGKLSLSVEQIPVNEVVFECEAMIEAQALKRGIRVSFPKFEANYFVEADRIRFKQILINLLSNAIKYNKENGAVVVSCHAISDKQMRICVEDTGEGLTPDKVAQLFQPFNRLGQEAYSQEGTGIGLVVCKRLVELMGGTIGVESTPGKGSTFWFELNLTSEPKPTFPLIEFTPVSTQTDQSPRTVLYIEDNLTNLQLVEDIISQRPEIRLLTAREGNRGLEIARSARPDVLLIDTNLPGMSSLETIKRLKEVPETAHIPIIAISSTPAPSDKKKGLEAGFFRSLTEPINVPQFMEALDVALEFAKGNNLSNHPDLGPTVSNGVINTNNRESTALKEQASTAAPHRLRRPPRWYLPNKDH